MTKEDRAAWTTAYQICDSLLPAMQTAAECDDTAAAARLFAEAIERAKEAYGAAGVGGKMILCAVYGTLEQIYRQKRGENAPGWPGTLEDDKPSTL